MKMPRYYSLLAGLMVVGTGMLPIVDPPSLQAAGIGGMDAAGGAGPAGGGHAASVSVSSTHSAAPAASHGTTLSHLGATGDYRVPAALRPMTATYSGPPRYLPGGFAPTAMNRPAANAGGLRASTIPAMTQGTTVTNRNPQTVPGVRSHNAWTDPSSAAPYSFQAGSNRGPRLPVNGSGPNGTVAQTQTAGGTGGGNNFSGQVLYPNVPRDVIGNGYRSGTAPNATSPGRNRGYHFGRRRYYGPYGYGDPYLISDDYAPYFYGDSGAVVDAASDYADTGVNGSIGGVDAPSSAAMNNQSPPDVVGPVTMPPPGVGPDAGTGAADAANDAPAPASGSRSLQSNTGPDSLVEAVQAELSRRGYFGGRVDAVYNDATHAAIQRFQADHRLAATGRINEATLHALQLD